MSRTTSSLPREASLADVLKRLGGISPRRIRLNPPPGKATERDVVRIHDRENRLYELVDGVLVEKVLGVQASCVAVLLSRRMGNFAEDESDLGFMMGADATLRLLPGLVRIPDVSFVSWKRVPSREYPAEPVPDLIPNLAVEVLSEGNTAREMERKVKDYFVAGVELVWIVDPETRTVDVYTAPDEWVRLTEEQTLDGGKVLPGFSLPLRELLAKVSREGKPGRKRKPRNGKKKR